jgi:hypothetical protein
MAVFTTIRRGLKDAGDILTIASDPAWASTQAISQVRQPMHLFGSAITSLFISLPAFSLNSCI